MNIENVVYILSNMDFSEWGIMGTLLIILQNTVQNAAASNSDTLIKWAVGIGSILSGVVVALFIKWTSAIKDHKDEIFKLTDDHKTEVSRLNTEMLVLQKEHSKELREMESEMTSTVIHATDSVSKLAEKIKELLDRYENSKRNQAP